MTMPIKDLTVEIDGRKIYLAKTGKGPFLVFVHGFPLDNTMWKAQMEGLAHHRRVICVDLPGFGKSDRAPTGHGLAQYADDVAKALTLIGVNQPVDFAGLSMGGYIAFQFYERYRERVRRLILCDTRSTADTPEAKEGRMKLAGEIRERGLEAAADAMIPRLFAKKTLEEKPELVAAMREVILRNNQAGVIDGLMALANRADVTEMLPKIAAKTLIIVGKEDVISTPQDMRAIARALPNAQYAEVPDAGHMAPFENPEWVNARLLKFLPPAAPDYPVEDPI